MPVLLVAPGVKSILFNSVKHNSWELTTEAMWLPRIPPRGIKHSSLPLQETPALPLRGGTPHRYTLLLLAAHHSEECSECRYDDQGHSDGNSSDGPSPRGMHWQISKGRLLSLSSITIQREIIFLFFST